ncbi:hypothetical protein CLV24_104161 [Pontibacter ummariensis]|uniref:Uncharacterized protein n=2 Tax=Pontibacter ummariensis TaxID=1610492 RepID=A0A239DD22_9BACT|nr:hypothetical protein CLV24_104161 [Pontibacter ummariensis]SNS29888.1 hypothetical protein SAMN06296052_104160 [Pontibacter ummariensis]
MAIHKKANRLKSILHGASSALNIYGSTKSTGALFNRLERVNRTGGLGRVLDGESLRKDWENVGSDMRGALNKIKRSAEIG